LTVKRFSRRPSARRQRAIEARDGKARRGALRFTLPPGYCWSEDGRIEIDPDERVSGAVRMVLAKYRELGSARQLFLWARGAGITLPVVRRNLAVCKIAWRAPAYHTVVQILHNPIYAGAVRPELPDAHHTWAWRRKAR